MHEIQPRQFVNSSSGGPRLIPVFFANPATGISQGSDSGPNLSVNKGAVVTVTTWAVRKLIVLIKSSTLEFFFHKNVCIRFHFVTHVGEMCLHEKFL
jgi:hypothetical protein